MFTRGYKNVFNKIAIPVKNILLYCIFMRVLQKKLKQV